MNVIYHDKTQHANFQDNLFFSSDKTTLKKQQLNGQKLDVGYFSAVRCYVVFAMPTVLQTLVAKTT